MGDDFNLFNFSGDTGDGGAGFTFSGGGSDGSAIGNAWATLQNPAESGSPYVSGALQTLGSVLTGYIGKRADVDIQRRLVGTMPYPQRWGVGGEIYVAGSGVPLPKGAPQQRVVGFDLGGLLPWLLIGGAVYLIARR